MIVSIISYLTEHIYSQKKIRTFVYLECYRSIAFFGRAYYNILRYIKEARGAFGLRKVLDYT